jgi:histidine ammonia-lyase/tyrosine ammonia-lyase
MIVLNGCDLTPETLSLVARNGAELQLSQQCLERVRDTHLALQALGDAGEVIYGVTTGFGELVPVILPPSHKEQLQVNLLRSHAAGGGEPLAEEAVRAMLVARLNCLIKGYSGCSVEVLDLMCEFLNRRIHPVVPSQGSLGASGDLAPLAHLALPVIGEGTVTFHGQRRPALEVLREAGLKPIRLGYKEALSLINGTSGMTGIVSLALPDVLHLLRLGILLSADLVSALRGSICAFDPRGHKLKNHSGQLVVASAIWQILSEGTAARRQGEIVDEIRKFREDPVQIFDTGVYIQNAYSLRCAPQILGPVLETINFVSRIVKEELNSCNDNPLMLDSLPHIFHGGNFHGQYVAMACDYLNIALTEIGVLAERQLDRLLSPKLNSGLPSFL